MRPTRMEVSADIVAGNGANTVVTLSDGAELDANVENLYLTRE